MPAGLSPFIILLYLFDLTLLVLFYLFDFMEEPVSQPWNGASPWDWNWDFLFLNQVRVKGKVSLPWRPSVPGKQKHHF